MSVRGSAKRPKRSACVALAVACLCPLPVCAQALLNGTAQPRSAEITAPGIDRTGNFDPADAAPPPAPAVPQDGDLAVVEPIPETPDGLLTTADPQAGAADGSDPENTDQRPQAERTAFEFNANPDAPIDGDNPLLFQIEEIAPFDPAQNRRPSRFATLDPYDPIGIRVGSFVLFPEVEIAAARFSNVFSEPNGQADIALELAPNLRLVSNWSNHALEFQATGDISNYRKFGGENDRGFTIESRGRIDVTRFTNLQTSISRQRSQESRSSIDAVTAGPRASVVADQATAALNHRFNRLSIQLRGGITDSDISPTETTDPVTGLAGPSIDDRDEIERRAAIRATWEFKPTLSVFAEVEGNDRDFEVASSVDNRRRDSEGSRVRSGVSFGQTSDILRGEVSVGRGMQDLDDARLADASGFIIDANLAWRMTGLTSLLFTAASDITSVTQTANSGAALERRVGLEARHAFRNYLIGSTGFQYTRRDFAGVDVDESEFVYSLGLEYFMNRGAVAFARYEHTVFRSDFENSDYDSDEVRVGLRLRR